MIDVDTRDDVLTTDAPAVDVGDAQALLRAQYGIDGVLQPLNGERDQNFHVRTANGVGYVFKIAHPAEAREVTNLQIEALRHIAVVDPALPVPHVIPTLTGGYAFEIEPPRGPARLARLLTYLPGAMLSDVSRTAALNRNLGAFAARVGRALRGFFHTGAGHVLLWDIRQAPRVRSFLPYAPAETRPAVARFIDQFEQHALPMLPRLRAQVIHNDMNSHNVVMDPMQPDRVAGLIDFGDMLHAPLVMDVAVACAYLHHDSGHPLLPAAQFAAAYHRACPLEPDEIDILYDLVAVRLAIAPAITFWQAERFPALRDYVLRESVTMGRMLACYASVSRDDARSYFHRACREGA